MLCFRDKTFCPYWQVCTHGETCERALTPEVIADGTKWWGSEEFPIAMYTDKPSCFDPGVKSSTNEDESAVN